MRIGEFARATGLSPDTLRYYEKIGLIVPPLRDGSGHRIYQDRDLDWARFVLRLRETGMPIAEMCRYARLRAEGAGTEVARAAILSRHRDKLRRDLENLSGCLSVLDSKIAAYGAAQAERTPDDRDSGNQAGARPEAAQSD